MRILVHREVGTKLPMTLNHRARDAFPFPFLGLRKRLLNGLDDQRTNRSASLCRSAAEQIMPKPQGFPRQFERALVTYPTTSAAVQW
jgi:hypothetical protein